VIKLGGVLSIWAHLECFGRGFTSGGSNPARLGELGGNHLPFFFLKVNFQGRETFEGFSFVRLSRTTLVLENSLFSQKIKLLRMIK